MTHLYHSTINFAVMHNQLFNRPWFQRDGPPANSQWL